MNHSIFQFAAFLSLVVARARRFSVGRTLARPAGGCELEALFAYEDAPAWVPAHECAVGCHGPVSEAGDICTQCELEMQVARLLEQCAASVPCTCEIRDTENCASVHCEGLQGPEECAGSWSEAEIYNALQDVPDALDCKRAFDALHPDMQEYLGNPYM